MNELKAVNLKITPPVVRAQLARILVSDAFVRARRMQRFLEFVVEQTLAGRARELGEYWIAVSVFDRGQDFEPALDPIVRNDARRLRVKLAEYYRHPQYRMDEIVIDIPKGGYVPVFLPMPETSHHEVAPSGTLRRVAVLPLELMSAADGSAALGRTISMSLTARLTHLDGIEAVAHGFLPEQSLRETASTLRLSHIVNGCIWSSGGRFRVIINLIQALQGNQVWAGEYEFESQEMASAHAEITADVLNEVKVRLRQEEPRHVLPAAA